MNNNNNTVTEAAGFVLRNDDGSIDWAAYDVVIVAFSGGKDSLACVLHSLDNWTAKAAGITTSTH